MAAYITSDVHLRLDRPERAGRFARWVEGLDPADALFLVGDLCDFWYASRQRRADPRSCPGLRAVAAFRDRGGAVTILPGNHDGSLGALYESALGARFVPGPLDVELFGLRVHLVHGHHLGARRAWKGVMESRTFLRGFGLAPGPLARGLEALLEASNARGRAASDRRHLAVYRRYAAARADRVDLVVFGHIHHPTDEAAGSPRLVVLGSWHRGASFLKLDAAGAALRAEP
ncbi:MAG TPA: metallophosphoesterase [Isosphaeraceae bacterium]